MYYCPGGPTKTGESSFFGFFLSFYLLFCSIMPFAYILFSHSLDSYYIGSTSASADLRLLLHNHKFFGAKAFTAKASDWSIFWSLETVSIQHAKRIERKIKSMKSRIYIQNLIKYPDLSSKFFNETL